MLYLNFVCCFNGNFISPRLPPTPLKQFFYQWQGRDDVVNDPTFLFLQSMPKGGVLHVHSGSSGDVDWLVNEGLSMDGKTHCSEH